MFQEVPEHWNSEAEGGEFREEFEFEGVVGLLEEEGEMGLVAEKAEGFSEGGLELEA